MPISPPTVGLSFGSFGDIVAVLQLAWELRAALDESTGASAELRALVSDVDAFTRALQDVQANVERRRRSLRPDVVNGIAVALSRCRGVLSTIQQRIAGARGQTSASGWEKYWGTAAWSILGGKKDVEALRARLSEQLGVMQLYLSLSEANSQERIQDALVDQSTTLQRIYTVVQDIQLRFDVGVPKFQFYDSHTQKLYPPFSRTSLQRLREICVALGHPEDGNLILSLKRYDAMSEDDVRSLSEIPAHDLIPINFGDRNGHRNGGAIAHFFREAAFGEWQVLLGSTVVFPDLHGVFKTLLERNHTVGAKCNCLVACSTGYRDKFNDMIWRNEAYKAYAEVLPRVVEHIQPSNYKSGWVCSLLAAFAHWPNPELLRLAVSNIPPRKLFPPADMVDLISKTPTYGTPLEPIAFAYDTRSFNDMFCFYVRGTALSESLVGHALPDSVGNTWHEIRLPDWAYISEGIFTYRRGNVSVSRMQHGVAHEAQIDETSEM